MGRPTFTLTPLVCSLAITLPLVFSELQQAPHLAETVARAAPAMAGAADWPTFLHDPMRTSSNSSETALSPSNAGLLTKAWSLITPATIEASAIVSNSTVYIGSWDGNEYALDQKTGAIKWKTFLGQTTTPPGNSNCNPPYSDTAGVTSSPTIQNGTAYLSGGDSYFYALDTTTGSVLWKVLLANTIGTGYYNYSSPVLANGFAYVGLSSYGNCPSVQGAVIQIDLATHQVAHRFNVVPDGAGGSIWGSPAYDAATNAVYVTTGEDNGTTNAQYTDSFLALSATDLSLKHSWMIPHDASFFDDADFGAGPTLFSDSTGRALVGAANKNGYFYALDRSTFQLVWSYKVGDHPQHNPVAGDGSIAPAAFANGVLYVAGGHTVIRGNSCAGSVRALNADNGNTIWESCSPGVVLGAVAYANGLVVIGAGNTLEVHAASNGALLYAYQESASNSVFLSASPSISNGQILEGSSDGTFLSFGLAAGGTPTPFYVQGNSADPQSSQAAVALDYPNPQAAGDLNVVAIGWNDTAATITSVSDSAGNSYQVAVPMGQTNGLRQAIYYAKRSAASTRNTVTVTFSQAATFPDIRIMEYANVDTSNPFDVGATGSGGSATADSGPVTTAANELLVGAGMTVARFSGAGSGYTSRMITSPDGDIVEDRVVTSAGSYSATATVTGAWLMQLATFRAATVGASPTATSTSTQTIPGTATRTPSTTATPSKTSTPRPAASPTGTPSATATPTGGPLFTTGLESGQPQPPWTDTVDGGGYPNGGSNNVGGICCGLPGPESGVRAELAHTGRAALMYSGTDTSAATSYSYTKVFDLSSQHLPVGAGTTLSYWIYPQSNSTSPVPVSGSNSTCVAIDLIFGDNSNLRDSGAVDQSGHRLHPAQQCGHLTLDTWNYVSSTIGTVAAGKTIVRVDVGYDQPANTGGYRGYIDDIVIR